MGITAVYIHSFWQNIITGEMECSWMYEWYVSSVPNYTYMRVRVGRVELYMSKTFRFAKVKYVYEYWSERTVNLNVYRTGYRITGSDTWMYVHYINFKCIHWQRDKSLQRNYFFQKLHWKLYYRNLSPTELRYSLSIFGLQKKLNPY